MAHDKIIRLYRNTLCVYSNIAADNIDKWLHKQKPSKKATFEEQAKIVNAAYKNIYFVEWAINNGVFFLPESNDSSEQEKAIKENYCRLLGVIQLLDNVRNYWSHLKHNKTIIAANLDGKNNETVKNKSENSNNEDTCNAVLSGLKDFITQAYVAACSETGVKIPDKYKASEGLFACVKKPEEDYKVIKITSEFTITGFVFYICLFLDGQQINEFLEAMEQSVYNFDELADRQNFRLTHPKVKYPESLSKKIKDFFYARDVYTYWRVRGHRDNILEDKTLDEKEDYYSLLEYLKRCPKERLELVEESPTDKNEFVIDNVSYDVREKNKFMEWGLEFWDNEIERLMKIYPESKLDMWKWGHHQTADYKHKIKLELKQQAENQGRPYQFPRYEKVVFDLPETEEERRNYRNDEHGFTYYLLKDDSNTFSQAMFSYQFLNGKKVIGLMGSRMLCSILEYYFWKYPVTDTEKNTENMRRDFFVNLFKSCYLFISKLEKPKKEKLVATSEKIKQRILFLNKQYSAIANDENIRSHTKIKFILDTWNQMLTYGQPTNLAHANDGKGITGGKNGYQELMRLLVRMDDLELKRKPAHEELIRKLKVLGADKTGKSYYEVINKSFQQKNVSNKLRTLDSILDIDDLFSYCKKYREAMLERFSKALDDFSPDDFRPRYEMRWLGLSDARTHEASQQTKPSVSRKLETNIINVDNKTYSAVGLPRDIRNLDELKNYIDAENLEKVHSKIYPSPNGCTLLIPEFFTKNGVELGELRGNQHVRKRLFLIRRQDTVLAHIAYQKGVRFKGKALSTIELAKTNFQEIKMSLPIEDNGELLLYIRFYYRYFKQNRYQLPMKLTKVLCKLLTSKGIVSKGGVLNFNRLTPIPKEEMTFEEKLSHLSEEEQNLPEEERNKLVEQKFAAIKPYVFRALENDDSFYMDELLSSYTICRRAIVEKLFKLEKRVLGCSKMEIVTGEDFIDFPPIAQWLLKEGLINNEQNKLIINIRNSALHCDIPDSAFSLSKDELLQKTKQRGEKNKKQKVFLDIFSQGLKLTNEILDKLDAKYPVK